MGLILRLENRGQVGQDVRELRHVVDGEGGLDFLRRVFVLAVDPNRRCQAGVQASKDVGLQFVADHNAFRGSHLRKEMPVVDGGGGGENDCNDTDERYNDKGNIINHNHDNNDDTM